MDQFQRGILLIGEENFEKLQNSHVLVIGAGGVGSFVIEALVRAGIGTMSVVDFDTIDITNINRQVIATHKTVGRVKAEVVKERALEINPNVNMILHTKKVTKENVEEFFEGVEYDYVVDCIDMVTSKLAIIENAKRRGIEVISAMGAGNKLNPAMFEVADISKTSVCPMARVIRRELKNRRIKKVKVVYSKEQPRNPAGVEGRLVCSAIGSIAFGPSVVGLIMAGEVVKDICGIKS